MTDSQKLISQNKTFLRSQLQKLVPQKLMSTKLMTLSQKFDRVAISTFPFRSFTHIISKKIFHALVASYKPCINYIDSLI